LVTKLEGGRERPACPKEGCGFFHFGDYSIGCGAVVLRDGKALLIQRGINPGRGSWQIPGGYVEADEEIHTAVEREVLEEAGVEARVQDVVGFRHAAGRTDRPNANIYVVFRLNPIAGEPRFDGVETLNAGFYSLDDLARVEKVQSLSLWAIRMALAAPPRSGLAHHLDAPGLGFAGWSLFGLRG
jgi:ADP-ribose pyrophosphatase YjhB (NUDIX family)